MESVFIKLNSLEKVKKFVSDMNTIEGEVLIYCGRSISNAKSSMEVLSLDLSKPLKVRIADWKEEYNVIFEKYSC